MLSEYQPCVTQERTQHLLRRFKSMQMLILVVWRTGQIFAQVVAVDPRMFVREGAILSGEYLQIIGMLMKHVRTESIRAYATKLEAGWVRIAL
jgi:hypothetical protein